MDYKEIIKERLNVLSPELRSFVLNENWRRDAEAIGKKFEFNEEKYASFENEIFLVLLCFEPKADFEKNLETELGIDINMAGWVAEDVDKNIFSKVANEIDAMWQSVEQEEPKENQNGVGESFEQIILNQAKAMQSARAPENLPTGEPQTEEKPKTIHDYSEGNDPYREPVE